MKAIIFPGQGSQKAGMASEFHSNFKIVKNVFKELMKHLSLVYLNNFRGF